MLNKFFCWWLESNRRPLELEATTLPTEPQPHFCIDFLPLLTEQTFCWETMHRGGPGFEEEIE